MSGFVSELKRRNVIRMAGLYSSACVGALSDATFDIKGNDYRLIAAVAYQYAAVYIKFVGTHKQYDAINADTVEIQ
jgi:mRNA interferase HigB